MRNVIACVVVDDAKVFNWLGNQTVLATALDKLKEVRGIQRIVCVATPKLLQQTIGFCEDSLAAPACELDADVLCLVNWLTLEDRPGKDMEAVIVIRPTYPCLPAGKIEACLHALRGGKADYATTAMMLAPLLPTATDKVMTAAGGCWALTTDVAKQGRHGKLKAVPVSMVEGLDIRDHDQYRLVAALEQTGQL